MASQTRSCDPVTDWRRNAQAPVCRARRPRGGCRGASARYAAQANLTTTIHINNQPIDVGPAVCVPGDLVITGNGVLHTTVNNAGDSWTTGTLTGSAGTTATPSATGRATAWFGVEDNSQNAVEHFIANAQLTRPDASTVRIHQEGQFTLNANGIPVVTRTTATCG